MPAPRHPYGIQQSSPIWGIIQPSTAGIVLAAILSAIPTEYTRYRILNELPTVPVIPSHVYMPIVGFVIGFGVAKIIGVLRWRLLKKLLAYNGWVTNPKSTQTKAWALILKLVKGPAPYPTFMFQPYIPKQPLPDLDATLNRWLQVCHQMVNKDEYELTREATEQFRANEGPILQKYLMEKSDNEDNWIYEYWLSGAYLSGRQSLIHSNYYINNAVHPRRTTDPVARGAIIICNMLRFAKLISDEQLPPVDIQDLIPLCMSGYRYMFNTTRVPGEHIDKLERYPGHNHIIIIRKGHMFKVNFYYKDSDGTLSLSTAEEIKLALMEIIDIADGIKTESPPVAALTGQKRSVWAKQRQELMKNNKQTLLDVESAMFVYIMDEKTPKDFAETAHWVFCGNGHDRWFDKSFNYTMFNNAWSGFNTEHSGLDGMVLMNLAEYLMIYEEYDGSGDIVRKPNAYARKLAKIDRLNWNIEGMEEAIDTASKEMTQLKEDIQMYVVDVKYGKGVIKKFRLSPDGYVQMVIQLAYYKMHKKFVKTYEPSTGRLFLLGRTETVNPVSAMSVAWVKAMCEPEINVQATKDLLKKAINYQSQYRLEATIGQGCDRHLFALMCASRELGMDCPKIFMDKAWQLPYELSTSQTPCKGYEQGSDIWWEGCIGGFAPVCQEGYGVAYAMFGDDVLTIGITSWTKCKETDSVEFGHAIEEAMEDMKRVLTQ